MRRTLIQLNGLPSSREQPAQSLKIRISYLGCENTREVLREIRDLWDSKEKTVHGAGTKSQTSNRSPILSNTILHPESFPSTHGSSMLLEFFRIALGNLWRMKLRSFLTMSGIVIGISALITLLGLANGFQTAIQEQFEQYGLFRLMHVLPGESTQDSTHVEPTGDTLKVPATPSGFDPAVLNADALDTLLQLEGVDFAYPQRSFRGLVKWSGGEHEAMIQALPASFIEHFPSDSMLIHGEFFPTDRAAAAVLKRSWMQHREIDPDSIIGDSIVVEATGHGDLLRLVLEQELDRMPFPDPMKKDMRAQSDFILSMLPSNRLQLEVAGITGMESFFGFELGSVLIPIEQVEGLDLLSFDDPVELLSSMSRPAGGRDGWPHIVLILEDIADYALVKRSLEELGFGVFSFFEQLDQIRKSFRLFDALLATMGALALLIASLGIANTMVMSITERTREIGILKSLGGEEGHIRLLFLVESAAIGLFGSLGGVAVGWVVCRVGSIIGRRWMESEGIPLFDLFHMTPLLTGGALLFGVFISVLAGLYPAARAAGVEPAAALREQ
ncbi:FtsX-like permease family protein [bacterium]|nr:FtsX-like permease family protein [bacterium]